MIDTFALALSHGLLLLAAWRLIRRDDLDDDSIAAPAPGAPRRPPFKARANRRNGDAAGA